MRPLSITLTIIGVFQLALGAAFVIAPAATASLLGLTPSAPGWANWLFAMMGARFLGYAYGMFRAARDPQGAIPWIDSMIAIQAIDWVATVVALSAGDVTLQQVTTAAAAPLLFIAALAYWHPRRARARASSPVTRGASA
jgi:hypothetical protein